MYLIDGCVELSDEIVLSVVVEIEDLYFQGSVVVPVAQLLRRHLHRRPVGVRIVLNKKDKIYKTVTKSKKGILQESNWIKYKKSNNLQSFCALCKMASLSFSFTSIYAWKNIGCSVKTKVILEKTLSPAGATK